MVWSQGVDVDCRKKKLELMQKATLKEDSHEENFWIKSRVFLKRLEDLVRRIGGRLV